MLFTTYHLELVHALYGTWQMATHLQPTAHILIIFHCCFYYNPRVVKHPLRAAAVTATAAAVRRLEELRRWRSAWYGKYRRYNNSTLYVDRSIMMLVTAAVVTGSDSSAPPPDNQGGFGYDTVVFEVLTACIPLGVTKFLQYHSCCQLYPCLFQLEMGYRAI